MQHIITQSKANMAFTVLVEAVEHDFRAQTNKDEIFLINLLCMASPVCLKQRCEYLGKLQVCFNIAIDGLVQERRNSIANALELRLSCTNPLRCRFHQQR